MNELDPKMIEEKTKEINAGTFQTDREKQLEIQPQAIRSDTRVSTRHVGIIYNIWDIQFVYNDLIFMKQRAPQKDAGREFVIISKEQLTLLTDIAQEVAWSRQGYLHDIKHEFAQKALEANKDMYTALEAWQKS